MGASALPGSASLQMEMEIKICKNGHILNCISLKCSIVLY